MTLTIQSPKSTQRCRYCGSEIFEHDPICVRDCDNACGDPMFFCNFACLQTHVDETELAVGDACEWQPG